MSSSYFSSRSVVNSTLKSDSESVDAITYRKTKDFDDSWPSEIGSAATCLLPAHPVSACCAQIDDKATVGTQALLSATFPAGSDEDGHGGSPTDFSLMLPSSISPGRKQTKNNNCVKKSFSKTVKSLKQFLVFFLSSHREQITVTPERPILPSPSVLPPSLPCSRKEIPETDVQPKKNKKKGLF